MNDSKSFIGRLILFVKREPVLWDKKNELYGNANAVNAAWEYIAIKLNEIHQSGYATGARLSNLWGSLIAIKEGYVNYHNEVGYAFIDQMAFLDKKKKKEARKLTLEEQISWSLFKHVFINLVFIGLYIYMLMNNAFAGSYPDCYGVTVAAFWTWCGFTGVFAIAALYSVSKRWKNRPNVLPVVMLIVFTIICIYFYQIMHPSMVEHYENKIFTGIKPYKCRKSNYEFATSLLSVFPLTILLSFRYNFVQVTSLSACFASMKVVAAAYYGSAVAFVFFIYSINWNGAYFLFFAWLLVNAKFSLDGIYFAWRRAKEVQKQRYSVNWNSTTAQFEIVLNGKEVTSQLSTVAVVSNKMSVSEKKVIF